MDRALVTGLGISGRDGDDRSRLRVGDEQEAFGTEGQLVHLFELGLAQGHAVRDGGPERRS